MARCGVAVLVLILLVCVAAAAAGARSGSCDTVVRFGVARQQVRKSLAACAIQPLAHPTDDPNDLIVRVAGRYKDNSSARGVVGTDAATVALSGSSGGGADRKAKLQQVVLGCTTSYDGQSFQASDGVLSLGNSNISFAARAAARFGGRFSYCLVDHLAPRNTSSYLTFGPDANGAASSSRTPLLLDAQVAPFYAVTVDAVSVAGEALDIPAEVWDVKKSGGAILDSGTSLTILATPAYKAVVAALSKQLAGVPRVTMDPFEYCYNWTATSTPPAVPKLEVRFAGAARLPPPDQELRHRRGARRQVHRAAGGRVARGVRHRQHPAAGAPLGVRPRQPLA
ncbi:Aspartic proteinase nepenthesin-2 [Triticum urartu]|uniref:Aspartic proteinase nepenthesin-2 n=1 Tax=Triticum urartu TaxID=4572 RepID=M7YT82_TRIUA|nr:Aspartic proteinase nepenthesin-2 [Triticum urartu]